MKVWNLPQGVQTILSNEEISLVHKMQQSPSVTLKRSLTEREQELARGLTQKGVLTRVHDQGKLAYQVLTLENIWRLS